MMNPSNSLGVVFIEETIRAFKFLQEKCAFGPPSIRYSHEGMSSDFTEVRYESEHVFLIVFYTHMEAELSLKLGLLTSEPGLNGHLQQLSLEDAFSLADVDTDLPGYWHPRLESDIKKSIDAVASLVREHLLDALCNSLIISKWIEAQKAIDEKNREESFLAQKRKEAQGAWEKKDYQKVVAIYSNFADHLCLLEQKRLDYAKKQI